MGRPAAMLSKHAQTEVDMSVKHRPDGDGTIEWRHPRLFQASATTRIGHPKTGPRRTHQHECSPCVYSRHAIAGVGDRSDYNWSLNSGPLRNYKQIVTTGRDIGVSECHDVHKESILNGS